MTSVHGWRWTTINNYTTVTRIVNPWKSRMRTLYMFNLPTLRLFRKAYSDLRISEKDFVYVQCDGMPDVPHTYLDYIHDIDEHRMLWTVIPDMDTRPGMLMYVCLHYNWKFELSEYHRFLRSVGSRRRRTLRRLKSKIIRD